MVEATTPQAIQMPKWFMCLIIICLRSACPAVAAIPARMHSTKPPRFRKQKHAQLIPEASIFATVPYSGPLAAILSSARLASSTLIRTFRCCTNTRSRSNCAAFVPKVRCSDTSVRKLHFPYTVEEISPNVTCAWCSLTPRAAARRDIETLTRRELAPQASSMCPSRITTLDCSVSSSSSSII